jgi:hypothetical protein
MRKRRDTRPVDKASRVVNAERHAKLDRACDEAVTYDTFREERKQQILERVREELKKRAATT